MSIRPIDLPYLIPDLPSAEEVMPFLCEIDGNRWYSNFGPLVQRLTGQIEQLHFPTESVHTLLCSTGTAALELGLSCLGLQPGARVLVPAFTFPASANAIENVGCQPLFCDVDPDSWVLTPDIAYEALKQLQFDAVMPVTALGRPVSAAQWDLFIESTGIPVIVDAAPALGNQQVGKHLLVAFSMHATKAFGIGEGGILAASDRGVIARARQISNFGMNGLGQVAIQGTNCKLSEYHAAVGLAQIKRWSVQQLKRARIETAYQQQMQANPGRWTTQSFTDGRADSQVLVPLQVRHSRSTMSVLLNPRVQLGVRDIQALLAQQGIGSRLWYNPGLHQHPRWYACSRVCRPGQNGLTTVDLLNQRLIGLPFHNFLTPDDISYVISSLHQLVESAEYSASLS